VKIEFSEGIPEELSLIAIGEFSSLLTLGYKGSTVKASYST